VSLYAVIFYLLAALILAATGLAITRKNPVHAVVFLVFSFLGSAMLFFLLGAPFLAALEVIIYAGAIMILFLFVIMMLRVDVADRIGLSVGRWVPAIVFGGLFLALSALTVFRNSGSAAMLKAAMATPRGFGRYIFERYWLAVEIISVLLLLGLLAAVLVGRGRDEKAKSSGDKRGEEP
jgi:NADH-quinone oxidoreductase subunit J